MTENRVVCGGCGQETDPDVCWCGSGPGCDPERDGHFFIPMGCDCFRSKSPTESIDFAFEPPVPKMTGRFKTSVLSALALVDQEIPECLLAPREGIYDPRFFRDIEQREVYCKSKSWAVPCSAAISKILDLGPVVEVGAGTGYWAGWISKCGGDVVAYDASPNGSHWCGPSVHFKVLKGGAENLAKHSDRVLFLCRPPYDTSLASNCLKAYRGKTLVFVGEGEGGCTADNEFFQILKESWVEGGSVQIPQWFGVHDYLTVYYKIPKLGE